jgi:integrase
VPGGDPVDTQLGATPILRRGLHDSEVAAVVRHLARLLLEVERGHRLVAGVSPKVVSERLGHSSVAFTLDTYAHVMPGMQPDAAKLFMDLVLGEVNPSAGQPNGKQSDERKEDA